MPARLAYRIAPVLLLLTAPLRADDAPRVADVLKPYVDRHELAGAVVLVADKDRVRCLEAVGHANIAADRPMTTDSLFWIASQSKSITAAALMMLVDEGKVKLDDPVATYLPLFRDVWVTEERGNDRLVLRRPRRPMTVRHILSHTSGLPFASRAEQPTLDLLPLRVGALSYALTPLHADPGAKYQYSNAGINTAGRIIEVVSHMPYEKFLDERLFGPLGMKDTTFWPTEEQLKRLANSYKPNAAKSGLEQTPIGQLKYPLNDRGRQPMPGGGLFSTAADVGRFCQMMLNKGTLGGRRYLSKEAVAEMTRKQTGEAGGDYGLGWAVHGRSFGHGGAHATNMTVDTERGLVLVYMIQQTGGFPGKGGEGYGAFVKAAHERFGAAGK